MKTKSESSKSITALNYHGELQTFSPGMSLVNIGDDGAMHHATVIDIEGDMVELEFQDGERGWEMCNTCFSSTPLVPLVAPVGVSGQSSAAQTDAYLDYIDRKSDRQAPAKPHEATIKHDSIKHSCDGNRVVEHTCERGAFLTDESFRHWNGSAWVTKGEPKFYSTSSEAKAALKMALDNLNSSHDPSQPSTVREVPAKPREVIIKHDALKHSYFVSYVSREKGTRYTANQFDSRFTTLDEVKDWIKINPKLKLVEDAPASPVDSVGVAQADKPESIRFVCPSCLSDVHIPYSCPQCSAKYGVSPAITHAVVDTSHAAKDAKIRALTDALEGLLEDTGIKDAIWLVEHKPGDEVDDEDARTMQAVEAARAALALPCAPLGS